MIAAAEQEAATDSPSDAPAPAAPADARDAAGRRMPHRAVAVLASIMTFSVTVVFFGAFAFGLSAIQEQRSQQQLYEQFRGLLDPSSQVAPSIGGAIVPGTPVALLNCPAAGIRNVVVAEGTSSGQLLNGPGHLRDSPLPGQVGESFIFGKSTTAGAPFGGVTRMRDGDVVKVVTGQGTFIFKVEDQRVAGDRLPKFPKSESILTLVTSAGSSSIPLAPSHIVYVDAALVGKAVNAPTGRPIIVPPDEVQGRGDPSAWPFVIFWTQALLAGAVGSVLLWIRWGRWQTWLITMPVMLGILWGLSNEVMRLLPNLY